MSDGSQNTIIYSYAGIRTIAARERALDLLDDLERNSVDFYATMRSAYLQNRASKNCYGDKSATDANNTYDFDFGIEEEDAAFNEMEDAKLVVPAKSIPEADVSNVGNTIRQDEIK